MTTDKQTLVMGIFRDRTLAEQAIDELRHTGWASEQVRLVGTSSGGGGFFDRLTHGRAEQESPRDQANAELAQLDLPEDQRQIYQRELERGSYLVVARPYGHQLEARDIFYRYGAYEVFTPLEMGGERTIQVRQEVPQVQKYVAQVGEIRIHKRVITEERTFTVPVTREEVTIERLPLHPTGQADPRLQANAVDGDVQQAPPVRATDAAAAPVEATDAAAAPPALESEALREAGTLRILVREEQVVIQKQPVVVEEILIHKQLVEETRQLVEPVRHEEVHVERIGNAPIRENPVSSTAPTRDEPVM